MFKPKKKTRPLSSLGRASTKHVMRGLVGQARSRAYEPGGDTRPVKFKTGIQRMMLQAGRELPVQMFDAFLDWSSKQIALAKTANGITPRSYALLSSYYDTDPIDFDRQIAWTLKRLDANRQKLEAFEKAFLNIEQHILYGNGNAARKALEDVERDFGPSIRILEARLAVEQFFFGLEAQKRCADSIRGKRKSGLIGMIVYHISMRNEPSVSLYRYQEIVDARLKTMRTDAMKDYVSYRLGRKIVDSGACIAGVLRIEESHSIFDLAHTLSRISERWRTGTVPDEAIHWLPAIRKVLTSISKPQAHTEDQRLSARSLANEFIRGDRSVRSTYRQLWAEPAGATVEGLQLLAFCTSLLRATPGKPASHASLLKSMAYHLAARVLALPGTQGAENELMKAAINFSSFNLPASVGIAASAGQLDVLKPWHSERAPGGPPYGLDLPTLTALNAAADGSLATAAVESVRWLVSVKGDRSQSTLSRFVDFAAKLGPELPRAITVNVGLAQAHALVELGGLEDLWRLISKLAICDKIDVSLLPLSSALTGKRWQQLAGAAHEIHLGIALDLFSRYSNDESLESYKRYALEDFLGACRADRPSALNFESLNVSRQELVYFLRFVCVQRTMELLPALNSSAALESERRAICSTLIKLDKENASLHNEEIIGMVHRARIAEGLRLVDRSRVHVDVDVLRKQLLNDLDPDFNRYMSLVAAGVGVAKNIDQVLRGIAKANVDEEWLHIPESEADDLLIQMVHRAADRFLYDQHYGLDSYLGRRIRHNSLTGQLRAPLDEASLITSYDGELGRYVENEYWLSRLSSMSEGDRLEVGKMLRRFSETFDEIGRKICTQLLHIRSQEFPEGVFELPIDAVIYHWLRSQAQGNRNLKSFLNLCFAAFWAALAPSLSKANKLLTYKTSAEIGQCFDELKGGLSELPDCAALRELTASVSSAQRSVFRQLEQIADWFCRSEHDDSHVCYGIEDATNISIEACLISHRGKNPNILKNIVGGFLLEGSSLFVLADIFWIAIDNACTHSGIPQGVRIWIDVRCTGSADPIEICIRNEIAPSARSHQATMNVSQIRSDIEKRRLQEGLRVEGKSGIKKIAAMVYSVEGGLLEFGYSNCGTFDLRVEIPSISIEGGGEVGGEPRMEGVYEGVVG